MEWGMPMGQGGRMILLPLSAWVTQANRWVLWNHGDEIRPFPPAFFARGVTAKRLVFAKTETPVRSLKAAFMAPFFGMVVLDSVDVSAKDMVFLAQMARRQRSVIHVIRPYYLSSCRGNPFVKFRLNVMRHLNSFDIYPIRGLPPMPIRIEV